MELFVLALQARILLGVGLLWLAIGLYLGHDPVMVSWRAAAAALVALVLARALLGIAVRSVAAAMVETADAPRGDVGETVEAG